MAFEDQTLTCVQCGNEFVFSSGEQSFFEERGLNAPPKRCKDCRQANKKKRRSKPRDQSAGEYRSPAFEGSAPAHQRIRGRRGPGHHQGGRQNRDYRSPAFGQSRQDFEGEYRSPGFKEYEGITPEEEYRSPAFKEYEGIKPEEEYRSPGFVEASKAWKDERPMFSIVCSACGQEAMVPFLPEEKENPLCQDCYKEQREREREAARLAEQEAARAQEEARAAQVEDAPVTAEEDVPANDVVPEEPASSDGEGETELS